MTCNKIKYEVGFSVQIINKLPVHAMYNIQIEGRDSNPYLAHVLSLILAQPFSIKTFLSIYSSHPVPSS